MAVAFFDIDGTLISASTWNFLFQHPKIGATKVRIALAKVTPVGIGSKIGLLGDALFREQWVRQMALLFRNWQREEVEAAFDEIVNQKMLPHYREDIVERLQQHKQNGDHVVLISGMFDVAARTFAARLGADGAIGTRLIFNGNLCAGRVAGRGVNGQHKLDYLQKYLKENQLSEDLSACYAYADSYSDHYLLGAVGHPTATYPDDKLRAHAAAQHWTILPS